MSIWLLDAGHGGNDVGAINGSRKESYDALRLVKRVGDLLKFNGESVYYTRTGDKYLSLEDRTAIENKGTYNYFVSIHRNDDEKKKGVGVETFSLSTTGNGRKLADHVQGELKQLFFNRGCKTANFYVLRKTKCPAILIEVGFIHNKDDNEVWDKQFEKLAQTTARGLLKQVGKTLKVPQEPSIGEGFFRVICGSFKERQFANQMQEKLKSLGIDSFLEYKNKRGS